jgi:hypothetical protein
VQPRRQHWFLDRKPGFPFGTPPSARFPRDKDGSARRKSRARSVTPGVALRVRTQGMPNLGISFNTPTSSVSQRFENLNLIALDSSGKVLEQAEFLKLGQRGIAVPTQATVEFNLTSSDQLAVSWTTSAGTHGTAVAARSEASIPSRLQPLSIVDWKSFKEFVHSQERNRFIYRGQSNSEWRLRTGFHRTGRANLSNFESNDINQLHRYLSASTRTLFELKNPMQNLAFLNLVQHHGYPTPLLDWSKSPYVAAFFAFRSVAKNPISPEGKVRIFILDGPEWRKRRSWIRGLAPVPPSLVVLEALPLENPRVIPQQSLSTVSTVDDIEGHIHEVERETGKKYSKPLICQ